MDAPISKTTLSLNPYQALTLTQSWPNPNPTNSEYSCACAEDSAQKLYGNATATELFNACDIEGERVIPQSLI